MGSQKVTRPVIPNRIVRNGFGITCVNISSNDANIITMPSVINKIVSELLIVLILIRMNILAD